jgi:isopenicillin-N epimerase
LTQAEDLKQLFLLDTDVIFLNHGSFGACPKAVFEIYQQWQRKLEHQPVQFLGRDWMQFDRQARQILANYLNCSSDDLVYVTNATHGVNIIARSLDLQEGDEILASNHEYGACSYTWEFICKKTGAKYIQQPVPFPAGSPDEIVAQLWRGVTPRTKIIFLSHITSPTSLCMPVEAICARAREMGILTFIDGAHAPGQIKLNLSSIGADFYTGNCHKWMLAPKGAAFLYTRKEAQPLIEPLVVSWGIRANQTTTSGSTYLDKLGYTGTRDPAASLSVPAAIDFQDEHHWEDVRLACHRYLSQAVDDINKITGQQSLYSAGNDSFYQMATVAVPPVSDTQNLKNFLTDRFKIEIPLIEWEDRLFIRISVQGYNIPADLEALSAAIKEFFY